MREPSLFLFDEPLSNLDAALRVGTRIEIAKLHRQLGATMIYVTHDQVEAMTLADKIVVLNAGRIEQVGRPLELYHRPANLFVAGFIGSPTMNFVTGEPAARLGAATIGVRPEHLRIGAGGAWTGIISHAEHLGPDTMVYVEVPGIGLHDRAGGRRCDRGRRRYRVAGAGRRQDLPLRCRWPATPSPPEPAQSSSDQRRRRSKRSRTLVG